MNRYQKKVNKLAKQRMFISPELNLRVKFRKIRKDIRKWYRDEFKEKDLKEIKFKGFSFYDIYMWIKGGKNNER